MEDYQPPVKHILHSGYTNETLRQWQSIGTELHPHNFMLPIFVMDEPDVVSPITSLPEVSRFGYDNVVKFIEPLIAKGLSSIILFGVVKATTKDDRGSFADSSSNPVILAVKNIKKNYPNLTVACDVCLCGYTNHGHCGILNEDGTINNNASIKRIGEQALAYAQAGADIVAPSDMMDSRIGAIKHALKQGDLLSKVSVLSYAVKFSSSFYGPFREAANSAPSFGDRRCYQLPIGSKGLASRAAARDVAEGADMLMVKPGLAYLDIMKQTKDQFPDLPLFVYQVSGEYAMFYHGAKAGAFKLEAILKETAISMRRAGADVIISYYTPKILEWMHSKQF